MSIALSIALYFVIWWVVLFAVLPFNGRSQAEAGEVVPGTPEGAPAVARLMRMFVINTIVATVVFAAVYGVIAFDLVSLGDVPEILPRS